MKLKTAVVAGVSLALLGLVVVLAMGFGKDPHAVPFVLGGKPAPHLSLKTLEGAKTVSLADFKGKPVVLNFWASWCVPCESEHPVLVWASRRYGEKVQFLGVVYQDEEERARRYIAEHGSPFPQLYDPESRVALDYGLAGVPETFFIDAQGIVRDKFVGPLDPDSLARRLARLTEPSAPEALR